MQQLPNRGGIYLNIRDHLFIHDVNLHYQPLEEVLAENVQAWRIILTLSLTCCHLEQVASPFLLLVFHWQERWGLDWLTPTKCQAHF